MSVPGYTYGAPPASFKETIQTLDATGMVTAVASRGVKEASGTEVGAIMLMKYNPKLTVMLDAKDPGKLLDGSAAGSKAQIPGKSTVTTRVLFGTEVRLIESDKLAVVIAYQRGGRLIQVMGPTTLPVIKFAGAYLATDR